MNLMAASLLKLEQGRVHHCVAFPLLLHYITKYIIYIYAFTRI